MEKDNEDQTGQARVLKEMSSSLPILDRESEKRMLKMWKSLIMWKVDKGTGNSDDFGIASDDGEETPQKLEVRYSPYPTPRRQLRIRAKEVMGFSGRVWQCERCDFWAYYKRDMRRHQSSAIH